MRLKKLILHGFKSFADRTEFVFDSPITGIVGPNGCGKSNVVDGFKWVLGEQSAKSLRGEAMLDVIFNGSGARKPSGMAEVTLVFENPKREDGTRMLALDFDEVSVGRRLYRDGTSEYQINNHTSRLKDIRELFLDTGVGVDAYSVIEQGRVAALLEANPEERRQIFEEAAGISKFKIKKKESQRKLEKVEQNLLRLTDIVEEVEKRLRSVKVQAGKARNYQEYANRLNALRLTYSLQEYHNFHTQLADLNKQREDAQFRLDDIATELQRSTGELDEKRQGLEALQQTKQRYEHELIQTRANIQSAKQRQQYASQQLEQIAEQIEQFERDRQAGQQRLDQTRQALEAETQTLKDLTDQLQRQRQDIEAKQAAFREGQLQANETNKQIDQNKSMILDLMRRLSQVGNRLSTIEIERKNIAAQQARLADRRRTVLAEVEKLDAARAESQAKLDATAATIARQQQEMEARKLDAASLGKQIATISEQLGAAKEHRSGLLSRQKLLKDLEARREGVSEGVQSVLRKRNEKYPFIRGLVADVMRVDVEHATVIEAALDGRDQWLVADDAAMVFGAKESLEELEGRVNILCREGEEAPPAAGVSPASEEQRGQDALATAYDWNRHEQRIRLAGDLVRFEPDDFSLVHHLLGRTVIVDSLDDARALYEAGPKGWRYVTSRGEVLEADGTLRAGPLTAAMGLLSRRSELDAIAAQIAEVDHRIERLTHELTEGNTQARQLEEQLNTLRNAIYQSNTAKVELTSALATSNDKLASLQREQPLLDRELAGLLDQIGKLKDDEARLHQQREQLEQEQSSRQAQVEDLTARQARLAEELRGTNEQLTAARVSLGQVQEKQLNSQQHVQRQQAHVAELTQQIERLIKSGEQVSARRGGVEEELEQARHDEQTLSDRAAELTGQVEDVTGRLTELQQAVASLAQRVEEVRTQHGEAEHAVNSLDIQLGEVRVRLETLVQRTQDELQLNLPEKYAAFEQSGGYQPAEMDWDAVADEIKELREKIHRLGNVNLDAITEQEELEQREQFLATQLTDLTESKRQLEELIDTINKESSLRFEQTFNAVREHFQGMFRKLFGGGKADIYLETELEDPKAKPIQGPDGQLILPEKVKIDPLDAGIEIIARPPGKQPVSISQLSGGEKAMTCIALLMSIFKSKPSPFCILDEVDAPLDEANNQRFGLIIQEFLELSQFIVITHHKRTMQICDVLYGVTMQEQGVSKRVAVKFDQVDSQGRISEEATAA